MSLHKNLTGDDIHSPITYIYADEAARVAATGFISSDVGKFAFVQDVTKTYQLTNESPITWIEMATSVNVVSWLEKVKDFFDPTSALPVGPSFGDRYIASATANGWTNQYIYDYNGSTWDETIPTDGDAVTIFDPDPNVTYVFDGTTWVELGVTPPGGNNTEIQYNSSGSFAGDSTFNFNATTKAVSANCRINNPLGVEPSHVTGLQYYDSKENSYVFMNDISDVKLNVGEEMWARVTNKSGITTLNGKVGYVSGGGAAPEVGIADATSLDKSVRTLGVFTQDIALDGQGYLTRFGAVRDMDTSAFVAGQILYLDPENPGELTNTRPVGPDYIVRVGVALIIHASSGVIAVDTLSFNGTDTSVNIEGTLNGVVTQTPKISFFNDGGDVYAEVTNEDFPTKDLPFVIDGTRYDLDTTSGLGPNNGAYIAIPEGTATTLQPSLVYADKNGGSPIIGVRTTPIAPSEEQAPICGQSIFSYVRTIADTSVFAFRRNNDAPNSDMGEGFNRYIADAIRIKLGTNWESGVDATVDINNVPTPGTLNLSTTAGIARQLHYQTFTAQDGTAYWVYNDSSNQLSYEEITDLNEITSDASGNSLEVNGTYYRLKVYGMQNSTSSGGDDGTVDKLLITRPLGQYSTEAEALVDANNLDVAISDVGIDEIVIELYTLVLFRSGPSGADFTLIENQDNRSRIRGGAGGGASGGASTDDKVRVTTNDTTNSYLDSKIVVGSTKLSKTINNPSGNEELELDVVEANIDHTAIANIGTNTHAQIDTHIASTANPHTVTIDQVTPTTTKGDLLVENGSNVIRLAVGTNDQVLTADSGEASGVKWATSGGGGTVNSAFSAHRITSTQSLTSGLEATFIANNEDQDAGGDYNNTTGVFTAPVTGWYTFNATVQVQVAAAGNIFVRLYQNSTMVAEDFTDGPTAGVFGKGVSATLYLTANDTVDCRVYQVSGFAGTMNTGTQSRFAGHQVGGI